MTFLTHHASSNSSWRTCYRPITQLAVPILIAHIIESLIPFINVKFAATLGEIALGASSLVTSTFFAFMGFCWGMVAAIGILAAHKIGEKQPPRQIGLIFWGGLVLSIFISLPIMLLFGHMDFFLKHLKQNPQVIEQAQQYMNGLLIAIPADLAKFAIFQFAIACGRPGVPMVANIVSVPFLAVLNYFLIQKFGIYGIGLGMGITYWLVAFGLLAFLLYHPWFKVYLVHAYRWGDFVKAWIQSLRLGLPIGAMFSLELLFFMVVALLMGYLGTTALAANQIAMQWMTFTVMLAFGVTEAVSILVAKAYGAKDYRLIKKMTWAGSVIAVALTLVIVLVYWIFPEWVIRVDLKKTAQTLPIYQLATMMLALCGVYQLIDAVRIVIAGSLRGIDDSQFPMWATIIGFWWVGLPICYIFAFFLKLKAAGLWMGLIAGTAMGLLLEYYRLQKKVEQNTHKHL